MDLELRYKLSEGCVKMKLPNIIYIFPCIIVLIFIISIISAITNGIKLHKLKKIGDKLINNQTNYLVEDYANLLKSARVINHPNEWQKLKNVFFAVYNSKTVSGHIKKNLYNELLKKGCRLGRDNFNFETEEERIKKSGQVGESIVAYNLKWLPEEYRVLYNIKLSSIVGVQEFDNIIIGSNGIFHIETKNFGGERGCKIKINSSGSWIKQYGDIETGMESPEFQLQRHDKVLKENLDKHYGTGEYIPHGIIVLSNPKTILEGTENSDVPVIKSDSIVKYISKYEGDKRLSQAEINSIYEKLQLIKR